MWSGQRRHKEFKSLNYTNAVTPLNEEIPGSCPCFPVLETRSHRLPKPFGKQRSCLMPDLCCFFPSL